MLTIIPTPIGNLGDITLRAIESLKNCDTIVCEDTRRTGQLLHRLEISKPMIILNDFNEPHQMETIIQKLHLGQNVCLLSDAGTPLISDPGYKLIRECINREIPIDSLPGPTAITTALTLSGLAPDKFLFFGFLPEKSGKRITTLTTLLSIAKSQDLTLIGFVSPYKVVRTIQDIESVFGNITICLARELTKIHQTVRNMSCSEWLTELKNHPPKGEYTILWHLDV
jgi:16S rRNA (cytidine1402-2'-O)-methyltransferase